MGQNLEPMTGSLLKVLIWGTLSQDMNPTILILLIKDRPNQFLMVQQLNPNLLNKPHLLKDKKQQPQTLQAQKARVNKKWIMVVVLGTFVIAMVYVTFGQ